MLLVRRIGGGCWRGLRGAIKKAMILMCTVEFAMFKGCEVQEFMDGWEQEVTGIKSGVHILG